MHQSLCVCIASTYGSDLAMSGDSSTSVVSSNSSNSSDTESTSVPAKKAPAIPPINIRNLLRPKAEVRRPAVPKTRSTVRTHYEYEALQRKVPNSFLLLPGGPAKPSKAYPGLHWRTYVALSAPPKSARTGILAKPKSAGKGTGKGPGKGQAPPKKAAPIPPPPKRN